MMQESRNRYVYLLLAVLLIVIGLPARLTDWYPAFIVIYVGDVIWATMIYLMLAFLLPRESSKRLFIIALLGCYIVEFSQLYQADWINTIRHLPLMGLILGYGFRIEDLIAYTLGISLAWGIDKLIIHYSKSKTQATVV